jgi:hypothetical protein
MMCKLQMLLDAAEDDRCQELSDACKSAEVVLSRALSVTNTTLKSELVKRVEQLNMLQQKHDELAKDHDELAKRHTALVYEHGFAVECNRGLHRELAMYSHLPRGRRRSGL